jgi:hypothetical protein
MTHEHKCFKCGKRYICTHKAEPEVLEDCAKSTKSLCDECFARIAAEGRRKALEGF